MSTPPTQQSPEDLNRIFFQTTAAFSSPPMAAPFFNGSMPTTMPMTFQQSPSALLLDTTGLGVQPSPNGMFDETALTRSASIGSMSSAGTPESHYASMVMPVVPSLPQTHSHQQQPQHPNQHHQSYNNQQTHQWIPLTVDNNGLNFGQNEYQLSSTGTEFNTVYHNVPMGQDLSKQASFGPPSDPFIAWTVPGSLMMTNDGQMPMALNTMHFATPMSTNPGMTSPQMVPTSPMGTVYPQHDVFPQSQAPLQPFYGSSTSRRPSTMTISSPGAGNSDDNSSHQKQMCTQCNKKFKDLKAHMLTHQEERPEKCPILTCDYHTKGFSRRYDRNRHTLTHYKGTMVCGFCPGSGSSKEKTFNRADVFKRHLTGMHGVEQTPPNSRRRGSAVMGPDSNEPLADCATDATGKCSTCPRRFRSPQDFYEHLDECVLRIVQQEDPAEAINAQCLSMVENDNDVVATLERNKVPLPSEAVAHNDDDCSDAEDNDEAGNAEGSGVLDSLLDGVKTSATMSAAKAKTNPANGVQKSRGMTYSRGGIPLNRPRGRKPRREYPSSWGFDKGQMNTKKRVLAVFEGQRRIAKDDMMINNEHEVRWHLADGNTYVTDLDVQTIRRAQGWHGATEEEKGPWVSDDPTEEDRQTMIALMEQQQAQHMQMAQMQAL
ncbi:hypothetical protein Cpir12675_002536 [Ceratocystis pirilliformis]|uniref:C2H2-type domain-containing protein n=1 Tax=Ceratocystis pirilliformis TaxID=259994 RepID=A0ABR3ZAB3_9PEZI